MGHDPGVGRGGAAPWRGVDTPPFLLGPIYQRPLKVGLPFGNVSVTVQDPEGPDVTGQRPGSSPGGCLASGFGAQPGAPQGWARLPEGTRF